MIPQTLLCIRQYYPTYAKLNIEMVLADFFRPAFILKYEG